MRTNNRKLNEVRPIKIHRHYTKYAEGSVLIEVGNTKVLCNASIDNKVPPFLKGKNQGWITAEYSMLPRATDVRNQREAAKGKLTGRSMEIQRLIGRSLRAIIDLQKLGEYSIIIDCDVIQADGGTRTASITGAYVALHDAISFMLQNKMIKENPLLSGVAAVSVGIVAGTPICDLEYIEDSNADTDMNIIMTDTGKIIEIQGTAEKEPFSRDELLTLLDLASDGIQQIVNKQRESLNTTI